LKKREESMFKPLLASSLVLLSALPALVLAQAAPASANSPAAPASSAAASRPAPPEYRSAFEGYQPYTDEKMRSWKEANDSVGGIGGWRAYAKEAQESAAPGAAAKPDPHAGHAKP
jgi:hypothetical protein